jgi:uncharacterized protein YecE (DUF72 family)
VRLRFGLGAWSNRHFDLALYPLGTPHAEYLPRYATLFDCAEADVLHHQDPETVPLAEWAAAVPEGFAFLPKMHKDATHGPTMRGGGRVGQRYAWLRPQLPEDPAVQKAQDEVDRALAQKFLASAEPLHAAGKLGPTLLQFGPALDREAGWDRMRALLGAADPGRFAVEVRHSSWFVPAFERLLEDFEAPLVWSTYPNAFAPPWRTASYGYVRFSGAHRPRRGRHVSVADRAAEVRKMATRLAEKPWKECFVIVTNAFEGNAVDSMPRIAEALGAEDLARSLRARPPAGVLFPDPPGYRPARRPARKAK